MKSTTHTISVAPAIPNSSQGWLSRIGARVGIGVDNPGLRLLMECLRERRLLFALTVILTASGALFEGLGVGLLIPFLEGILTPEAPPLKTGITWVDSYVLAAQGSQMQRLLHVSGVILLTVVLRALLSYGAAIKGIQLSELVGHRLRERVVDQVQSVSIQFFSQARTGEILNTLITEVNRVVYLLGIYRTFLINGFMLLAYGATVVFISWQLSLFALLFCAFLLGILTNWLKRLRDNGTAITESNARLASMANDLIAGIRTINEFGTQERERERFFDTSSRHAGIFIKAGIRYHMVPPITQALATTALVFVVIIAVKFLISTGAMTAASLIAFLVVLLRLLPSLQIVNGARAEWAVYRGSLNTVAGFLNRDDKPYLRDGWRPLPHFEDKIELQQVDFGYDPGNLVLKDINLTITRGVTTAIVGGSGAGKSTLIDLIARFYDPIRGLILLDGKPLHEYKLQDLRSKIAVVNQSTFLFNDTVRANISYGLDNITDQQIRDAASKANALEFIDEMPDGFDTLLGERGTRLSGGQRQRIAIARALLRDPEILVLDEATSALDSVSERLVQEALEYLMQERTVIVIAHRLSTIEKADHVVVLEAGRIVEKGRYEDLLERKGQLWKYHSLQFQAA